MFDFFRKKSGKSRTVAKERLKLVLVHDRADLSPMLLERIKEDIIRVISKYVEVDNNLIEVKLTRNVPDGKRGTTSALEANIPIIRAKERR